MIHIRWARFTPTVQKTDRIWEFTAYKNQDRPEVILVSGSRVLTFFGIYIVVRS